MSILWVLGRLEFGGRGQWGQLPEPPVRRSQGSGQGQGRRGALTPTHSLQWEELQS